MKKSPLLAKDGIAGEIKWLREKGASRTDIAKMLAHAFVVVPIVFFTTMYVGITIGNAVVPTNPTTSAAALTSLVMAVALTVGIVWTVKTVCEWTDPVSQYNNPKLHQQKVLYRAMRSKYRKALKAIAKGKFSQSGRFRVVDGEIVEVLEDGDVRPVTY